MTIIKRITLAGVLTAMTTLATHAAAQTPSGDVIITVNGNVVASCLPENDAVVVDLGDLFTYDLQGAGSSSEWVVVEPLVIKCRFLPALSITASFTGMQTLGGNFGNNQGDAVGVELQLADENENLIPNGGSKDVPFGSDGEGQVKLKVRAISPNGNPTAGDIDAIINVSYTYS